MSALTDMSAKVSICIYMCAHSRRIHSTPASPIWRGGPPLLPFPAAPLPFLSCLLSYFNSRHKILHFGENFMNIGPKLKMLSMFKGQCYVYSIFEVFIVELDYIL